MGGLPAASDSALFAVEWGCLRNVLVPRVGREPAEMADNGSAVVGNESLAMAIHALIAGARLRPHEVLLQ